MPGQSRRTCVLQTPGQVDQVYKHDFFVVAAEPTGDPDEYKVTTCLQYRDDVLTHLLGALGAEMRLLAGSKPMVVALAVHEFATGLRGTGGIHKRRCHVIADATIEDGEILE